MRSGLFLLPLGLLALGANLPGTSGQNYREKLLVDDTLTFLCVGDGVFPEASVGWFRNGEAAGSVDISTRQPSQRGERQNQRPRYLSMSLVLVFPNEEETFSCEMGQGTPFDLTVQKTKDKDAAPPGYPMASNETIFRPRFQEDEDEAEISITCIVKGKRPPGTSITWQENGCCLLEGTGAIRSNRGQDPSFLYSTLTLPSACGRLTGKRYSCLIAH